MIFDHGFAADLKGIGVGVSGKIGKAERIGAGKRFHRSAGSDTARSWSGSHVGPVFATAVYLSIMQLDNAALPIYQR